MRIRQSYHLPAKLQRNRNAARRLWQHIAATCMTEALYSCLIESVICYVTMIELQITVREVLVLYLELCLPLLASISGVKMVPLITIGL